MSRIPVLLFALLLVSILGTFGFAFAEPCLMVYPQGPSIYHYSSAEEYVVGPGEPGYDAAFDRGGQVLLDVNDGSVPLEIYQAPGLVGFELDEDQQGWFFTGTTMTLIVDGWSNQPTTYSNITVVFDALAASCAPNITVNGQPVTPVGSGRSIFVIGDLQVQTPTANGNNYSDTVSMVLDWSACAQIDIWAFADENSDGIRQGQECKTAFSKNTTVPVEAGSWGGLKALFEN